MLYVILKYYQKDGKSRKLTITCRQNIYNYLLNKIKILIYRMFEQESFYKYIGLIAVIFIGLYIGQKVIKYQSKVVETLTSSSGDPSGVTSSVTSNTDKISDTLLISKYRTNYEDTIIGLEKAVGLGLLSEVVNNAATISADPTSSSSLSAIKNINELKSFRESLNQSMIILDKNA